MFEYKKELRKKAVTPCKPGSKGCPKSGDDWFVKPPIWLKNKHTFIINKDILMNIILLK